VSNLARLRLLSTVSVLAACSGGESASAVLTWDAVTDPNLGGYRVYVGTAPGVYDQPGVGVGNNPSHQVVGLRNQARYEVAVSAVDFRGSESAVWNVVSKTSP
jgi:hypothetical protein